MYVLYIFKRYLKKVLVEFVEKFQRLTSRALAQTSNDFGMHNHNWHKDKTSYQLFFFFFMIHW